MANELIIFTPEKLFQMLGMIGLPPGALHWADDVCKGWEAVDCAPIAQEIIRLVEEYREH